MRAIVATIVLIVLVAGGGLFLLMSARSYTVKSQIKTAYAIWDDTQLVLFVHSSVLGRSSTFRDDLRASAAARFSPRSDAPWTRWADVTTVVRYEPGVIERTEHVSHDVDSAEGFPAGAHPRFAEGRALVAGGFWNGRAIEPLPAPEYARLISLAGPPDMGRWHGGPMLQIGAKALTVRVRGETGALTASRRGAEVFIDLVRGSAPPVRLFDATLDPHFVSAREYESTLQVPRREP
jgi:hypothetical protein